MSELIVFAFPTETDASEMDETIHYLMKEELIALKDAAVVIRKPDGKIKVKQATNLVGVGAFGGAFWGMLIGLLFWAPWLDSVPKSSDFHYLFHLIMTFLKISFISTLTSSSSLTLSAKSFQIFIESPLYLEAFNFFNEIIRYAPLFRQEILTLKPFTMPGMA